MENKIDKKLAKRKLWIEYLKGAVTVLVFLAGLALVSNFVNIYFAVKYGFGINQRPWYSNFALLLSIVAYMFVFFSGYKILGFKFTDKIDDLKTMLDQMD